MCSMTSTMVARSGTCRDPHVPAHPIDITSQHLTITVDLNSVADANTMRGGEQTLKMDLLERTWVVSSRDDVREQHRSCRLCWLGRWCLTILLRCAPLLLLCGQALQPALGLLRQLCVVVHSCQRLQLIILLMNTCLSLR